MPARTRGGGGVPLLTPVDTFSSPTSRDYLRGPTPSWNTLVVGLVVFVFLIITALRARRALSGYYRAAAARSNLIRHPAVSPDQRDQNLSRPTAWSMEEKPSHPKGTGGGGGGGGGGGAVAGAGGVKGHHVSFKEQDPLGKKPLSIDPTWKISGDSAPRLMSRPPPAPPLTPPELSTAVFTFEDRPRGNDIFLQQPNPDYLSSTSTSLSQSSSASPPTPRRRSYNKTLPIGIPTPQTSSASESDPADLTFSPSSFPPTSPLLPPAPPGMMMGPDDEAKPGPGGQREIDVQGEIISVLDGDGAGWTRHTRVYGGGVCLACAASGGNHGGGFYGATVRPEEMR